MAQLGFSPYAATQSPRNRQSFTLACLVRNLTVPVLASFAEGMQQELDQCGYGPLIASSNHALGRERDRLATFVRHRVDGQFIATFSERHRRLLKLQHDASMPVLLLDRGSSTTLDSVRVDHAGGTRRAIVHLLALGRRCIAVIACATTVRPVVERVRGVDQAFADIGLQPDLALVRLGSFSTAYAKQVAAALLDQVPRQTVFFVAGTAWLQRRLRALQERGLPVPRDVSVMIGAESELAAFHAPPILGVALGPRRAWGRRRAVPAGAYRAPGPGDAAHRGCDVLCPARLLRPAMLMDRGARAWR